MNECFICKETISDMDEIFYIISALFIENNRIQPDTTLDPLLIHKDCLGSKVVEQVCRTNLVEII